MTNLYSVPPDATALTDEFSETLLSADPNLRLERIISHGQTTPEGRWYDQDQDEWVAVIQGEARIGFEDGKEILLREGDTLFLPKRRKHRVAYTSAPCVWIAVFGDELRQK